MYDPIIIANFFIKHAAIHAKSNGDDEYYLGALVVQKLVHVANGFHLAFFSKPLVSSKAKIGRYDPYYKKLKKILKPYGGSIVTEPIRCENNHRLSKEAKTVLDAVWAAFINGRLDCYNLSPLTRGSDDDWRLFRKERMGDVLSENEIKHNFLQHLQIFNDRKVEKLAS